MNKDQHFDSLMSSQYDKNISEMNRRAPAQTTTEKQQQYIKEPCFIQRDKQWIFTLHSLYKKKNINGFKRLKMVECKQNFMDCNVAFLDPCHTPPACNPRKESIRGEENIGREAKYPLQRQGILII